MTLHRHFKCKPNIVRLFGINDVYTTNKHEMEIFMEGHKRAKS